MKDNQKKDVIIIGGSYSGLSAAMALGRSLQDVLIIDDEKPCNEQTPHSHNFLTEDGQTPQAIFIKAKENVEKYATVKFVKDFASEGFKTKTGYQINTLKGATFFTNKLIFATGIKDLMPNISGFRECWGISVIHCPYCHGYEVRNKKTGVLGNSDYGFEFSKLISNLTKDLTLFTNGKSTLSDEQTLKLKRHGIEINEAEIDRFDHQEGYLKNVVFKNGSKVQLQAIYAKTPFVHHCDIPSTLGCEFTDTGHISVDGFQRTSQPGIYACGDNTTMMRSVSNAVAMGTLAGAAVNKEIIDEEF